MKANKTTVTVTVEVLDVMAATSLLHKAAAHIGDESERGELNMTDGDRVEWKVEREDVEF